LVCIADLPLRHLLRFRARFEVPYNLRTVYLAAVIPVKNDLEIRYSQVEAVFRACEPFILTYEFPTSLFIGCLEEAMCAIDADRRDDAI
jgi:hypothetical protein